jgi:CubicO group peptidase (beta-lactamase class C family)
MKRILLMLLLAPVLSGAQTIAQKADELLTTYTNQNKFSGNVLIAQKGKVIFQKAYGYADRETNRLNTLETEFRIGSLTKMFTSAAILKLAECSKLSLTDPVSKFIPNIKDGDKIQIVHLLSHTSGIKGSGAPQEPTSIKEAVDGFQSMPLAFKPGERFEYNNFNYILLSYIVEKISGVDFASFLRKEVLVKAGMKYSGIDDAKRRSSNKAVGYFTNPQTAKWEPANPGNVAMASGAGALYSTLSDLLQWSEAITANKVLSLASFQKAVQPVQGNYGLGWIINNKNGHSEIGHTGSIEGFIANFMKYPEEDITIIILSNYRDLNGRQLSDDLTSIVFGTPYTLPRQKKEIALTQDVLNKYAGVYQLNEHFRITVSVENNKLYGLAPGDQDKIEFAPESETKFFFRGPETEVEFIQENGKVQYLFIKMQGGMKLSKVG